VSLKLGPPALFGERGDVSMRLALAISAFLIVAAPFFGRWRANVWLKKHVEAERPVGTKAAIKAV
jgi:hypothetical protein